MQRETPTTSAHNTEADEIWEAAEEALQKARQRRAGKLRLKAHMLRRATENKRAKT